MYSDGRYNTINRIIWNACMVSWRAKSEVRAVTSGKNGEAGLRENMGKII